MKTHKWYVGTFWNPQTCGYRIFAVPYSDTIPTGARNVSIIWATSAQIAQEMYSWYYKEVA